jgi:hypothetical protein
VLVAAVCSLQPHPRPKPWLACSRSIGCRLHPNLLACTTDATTVVLPHVQSCAPLGPAPTLLRAPSATAHLQLLAAFVTAPATQGWLGPSAQHVQLIHMGNQHGSSTTTACSPAGSSPLVVRTRLDGLTHQPCVQLTHLAGWASPHSRPIWQWRHGHRAVQWHGERLGRVRVCVRGQ